MIPLPLTEMGVSSPQFDENADETKQTAKTCLQKQVDSFFFLCAPSGSAPAYVIACARNAKQSGPVPVHPVRGRSAFLSLNYFYEYTLRRKTGAGIFNKIVYFISGGACHG